MATCFKCEKKLDTGVQESSLFKPIHHHCQFILTVCSDCLALLNIPKCTCASILSTNTVPLNHGNKASKKPDLTPIYHQQEEE
jgi:hypothetical protein